jgi:hypothetical protein
MNNESGTPPDGRAPNPSRGLVYTSINNSSAKNLFCKPPKQTLFGNTHHAKTASQLEKYFSLGLTPIPLKGKRPLVKWKSWHPNSVQELKQFIRPGVDWGVKTGKDLVVIDFDNGQAYVDFIVANIDKIPQDAPVVKTGRGYHLWMRCKEPVHNQHYEGIDIKGAGGYVVAPPSIHATGRKYKFIRAPNETIPEVDIETLDFPKIKDERQLQKRTKVKTGDVNVPGERRTKEYWDAILANGISEGSRHITLVRLVGWLLFYEGAFLIDLLEIAKEWNQRNRPPLPDEEVETTVRDCWARWGTPVPIKTLVAEDSVIVETGQTVETEERPQESSTPTDKDAWGLESPRGEVTCGTKHRIVRKGRQYVSIAFFCGRWSCPRCSRHFHHRWVKHLSEISKGQKLYVLKCDEDDWGRVRRSINRLKADYLKVREHDMDTTFTIVLNKPHPESGALGSDVNVTEYLDKLIPTKAYTCPISTSRGWDRTRDNTKEYEYKTVLYTWLTLEDQKVVAQELGAEVNPMCESRWESPEDVDADKWENKFYYAIRNREDKIEKEEKKARRKAKLIPVAASEKPKIRDDIL